MSYLAPVRQDGARGEFNRVQPYGWRWPCGLKVRGVREVHDHHVKKKTASILTEPNDAHIAIHKDAAMASVDVKNAHGAVEWGAIQNEIEAPDKNLWMWCAVLFKKKTR